jgi:hypothetical protein
MSERAVRTGTPEVDAALERLDTVAERPVSEHPDIYDDVHRQLQGALVDLDGD